MFLQHLCHNIYCADNVLVKLLQWKKLNDKSTKINSSCIVQVRIEHEVLLVSVMFGDNFSLTLCDVLCFWFHPPWCLAFVGISFCWFSKPVQCIITIVVSAYDITTVFEDWYSWGMKSANSLLIHGFIRIFCFCQKTLFDSFY